MNSFSNAEDNDMTQARQRQPRRFTGYHAAAIIVAFFAVVIAVNVAMATLAVSTFGGTVVDNSYVAGQEFNGWLREARREKELGWTVAEPVRDSDRIRLSVTDALGQPLRGAAVEMRAEHPLGRAPDRDLRFTETQPGTFVSTESLPAGRWKLRLQVRRDAREMNVATEVR